MKSCYYCGGSSTLSDIWGNDYCLNCVVKKATSKHMENENAKSKENNGPVIRLKVVMRADSGMEALAKEDPNYRGKRPEVYVLTPDGKRVEGVITANVQIGNSECPYVTLVLKNPAIEISSDPEVFESYQNSSVMYGNGYNGGVVTGGNLVPANYNGPTTSWTSSSSNYYWPQVDTSGTRTTSIGVGGGRTSSLGGTSIG